MSRRALVTVGIFAAVNILMASPAQASPAQGQELPGPPESYLFTVDSPHITIKPGKGDAAKVVIA